MFFVLLIAVFSGILMNEEWCLFFEIPTSGNWFNMAAPSCIYMACDNKPNNFSYIDNLWITSINILIDSLFQKFPLVNNLHIRIFQNQLCFRSYFIWFELKSNKFSSCFIERKWKCTFNVLKVHTVIVFSNKVCWSEP